jgi:DNA-directed RNA polymerase specialized sigma subunit
VVLESWIDDAGVRRTSWAGYLKFRERVEAVRKAREHRTGPECDVLVLRFVKLPFKVLHKLQRYHRVRELDRALDLEDLVQEGYLALLHAATVWDDTREGKFEVYAWTGILRKILGALQRAGRSASRERLFPANDEGHTWDPAAEIAREKPDAELVQL